MEEAHSYTIPCVLLQTAELPRLIMISRYFSFTQISFIFVLRLKNMDGRLQLFDNFLYHETVFSCSEDVFTKLLVVERSIDIQPHKQWLVWAETIDHLESDLKVQLQT